jgi:uncharacterized protein YajQ (UPF0234 family)
MPSFDVVSEVDMAEVKNAVLQTQKELHNRFDYRGTKWEITEEKDSLVISADNEFKLKGIYEILTGKLAKRNVSLKNIDPQTTEVSSVGRARQIIKIKQGFEGQIAKDVSTKIRGLGLKVQAQIEGQKVRVTGKSRDDLQQVIQFLREEDFPVVLNFDNFRD